MPKLIANERFYYAGRNVEMGEQFIADEIDVDLLTHAIKPMARVPDRVVDPEPETKAVRYKRRDVKAED